jgi:hypothetical protein
MNILRTGLLIHDLADFGHYTNVRLVSTAVYGCVYTRTDMKCLQSTQLHSLVVIV